MSSGDSHLRLAAASDAPQVWPLARDFATSFQPERDAFEATFAELVGDPMSLLLVAEAGERIIGYLLAGTHLTFLANGPVAWVEEVMVAEADRGRGIGRMLMAEAEKWSSERGAAYVSLASRRASDFYLALGYTDSATFFKKTPSAE